MGGQLALERLQIHAVGLHGHADQLCAVAAEGVQTADEGRVLGQDDVARVDQCLGGQIGALLAARDDVQLIFLEVEALGFGQIGLHGLAQRGVAFAQTVLQHRDRVFPQHLFGDLVNLGGGEGLGRRIAAAERDHIGVCAQLEQLADHRAMHAL